MEDDVCAESAAGSLPSHPLQKVQIFSLPTDDLILGGGADEHDFGSTFTNRMRK